MKLMQGRSSVGSNEKLSLSHWSKESFPCHEVCEAAVVPGVRRTDAPSVVMVPE